MPGALPAPDAVRALLASAETRNATLDALEAHAGMLEPELSLALTETMAKPAPEIGHATSQRVSLLLARPFVENITDPNAIAAAAFGDGRFAVMWSAEENVVGLAAAKSAAELTAEDARSFACFWAYEPPASSRGSVPPVYAAAGLTLMEGLAIGLGSRFARVDDAVALRMSTLLIELIRAQDLPELMIAGVWKATNSTVWKRPANWPHLVSECGIFELAASTLREFGPAADYLVRMYSGLPPFHCTCTLYAPTLCC